MHAETARYSTVAIVLHWLIAVGILFMIWLGWNMHGNENMYQLHKSIGITILILTVARIVWRALNPPPSLPADMKGIEKLASHLVHLGFYGLMILMPLTGWALVSTSYEFDVPTVLFGQISWPDLPGLGFLTNEPGHNGIKLAHDVLAKLALALLVLHIAGALKHEFSAEQGVLKRMLPGLPFLKGDLSPPSSVRGGGVAFGGALGVFVLIAFVPSWFSVSSVETSSSDQATAQLPVQTNWRIDYAQSEITFQGLHGGNEYTGQFGAWEADILFDPSALSDAEITVRVETGSVQTNKKLYTDSLVAAEWFNAAAFPIASVSILRIEQSDSEGYAAEAELTFKAQTVTVPFAFTLTPEGAATRMRGTATLYRQPLDLGQLSDPGADWVSEEVNVNVSVLASRLD